MHTCRNHTEENKYSDYCVKQFLCPPLWMLTCPIFEHLAIIDGTFSRSLIISLVCESVCGTIREAIYVFFPNLKTLHLNGIMWSQNESL